MYRSVYFNYLNQIHNAILWYVFIQLLFSVTTWFVFYQMPKYKIFMFFSLTISILQIGLSMGYLLHQEKIKKSITYKTELNDEWRNHEIKRVEKLILGYNRTISIWFILIVILVLGALTFDIKQSRHIAFAFIIQLGFTLILDIYGRVKTEHYYQLIK